jgi:transcriptional regulator with PAS, ATPase and Fis domain
MSSSDETRIGAILIGESRAIRDLRREIARFARSSLPILIQGPTGSGKELVAQAIHLVSGRDGPFVPFNICALSDGMFEDALFGHVRGAFTGASQDAPGYLAEANGGSVLLDEISGLSLQSQSKLLRALETGAFRPVGAARDRRSDFRLLAASNENLERLAEGNQFRNDLLYRIGGHVLRVPPLDDRLDDIPALTRHFLSHGTEATGISPEALAVLGAHRWAGNIRQLRHTIGRALVLSDGDCIESRHVAAALGHIASRVGFTNAADSTEPISASRLGSLLERHEWNTVSVADELAVHRATLYRWMKRHGLSVPAHVKKQLGGAPPAPEVELRQAT